MLLPDKDPRPALTESHAFWNCGFTTNSNQYGRQAFVEVECLVVDGGNGQIAFWIGIAVAVANPYGSEPTEEVACMTGTRGPILAPW